VTPALLSGVVVRPLPLCMLCGVSEVHHVPITRCPLEMRRLLAHFQMLDGDDEK
jgi:hypothetical protein